MHVTVKLIFAGQNVKKMIFHIFPKVVVKNRHCHYEYDVLGGWASFAKMLGMQKYSSPLILAFLS